MCPGPALPSTFYSCRWPESISPSYFSSVSLCCLIDCKYTRLVHTSRPAVSLCTQYIPLGLRILLSAANCPPTSSIFFAIVIYINVILTHVFLVFTKAYHARSATNDRSIFLERSTSRCSYYLGADCLQIGNYIQVFSYLFFRF